VDDVSLVPPMSSISSLKDEMTCPAVLELHREPGTVDAADPTAGVVADADGIDGVTRYRTEFALKSYEQTPSFLRVRVQAQAHALALSVRCFASL
jgi:hypothetical protein